MVWSPVAPSGHSPLSMEDWSLPRPSVARAFSVCFPFGTFFQTNFQKAQTCDDERPRKKYHARTTATTASQEKALRGRSGSVGFRGFAEFTDHVDEGLDGAREAAVAAIDQRQFAPEVHAFDI